MNQVVFVKDYAPQTTGVSSILKTPVKGPFRISKIDSRNVSVVDLETGKESLTHVQFLRPLNTREYKLLLSKNWDLNLHATKIPKSTPESAFKEPLSPMTHQEVSIQESTLKDTFSEAELQDLYSDEPEAPDDPLPQEPDSQMPADSPEPPLSPEPQRGPMTRSKAKALAHREANSTVLEFFSVKCDDSSDCSLSDDSHEPQICADSSVNSDDSRVESLSSIEFNSIHAEDDLSQSYRAKLTQKVCRTKFLMTPANRVLSHESKTEQPAKMRKFSILKSTFSRKKNI